MSDRPGGLLSLIGVTLAAILGLPATILLWVLGKIFHKSVWPYSAGTLALGATFLLVSGPARKAPPSPSDTLTREDVRAIYLALLDKVDRGGHNHLHCRRLFFYAPAFARAAGANVDAVRAAALLHDATKERGVEDPKERFCTHGAEGAKYAAAVIRRLGKSDAFVESVSVAIEQHMGPAGFSWSHRRNRFMTRFCSRSYPKPGAVEAKVLYDIDMLDLMTVDGVLKVVNNRQTNPEFGKETLKQSALTGSDSAWASVQEADQTLITPAAKKCGDDLTAHSKAFLDQVDWDAVKDVKSFAAAVQSFKQKSPVPSCLPAVPTIGAAWDAFDESGFQNYDVED